MPRPFIPSSIVLFGALLGMPLAQAEVDLQGLVKNSPFGEGKAPGEKSGALEFRGVYVDQGVSYFSIYNPATKSSTWIAQGEASPGPLNLAVKSYDETGNTLIVENNGQPVKMKLHESVIVKIETPAPTSQPEARNAAAATTASGGTAGTKEKSAVTSEQAQAFREQMRQRWTDRQNTDKGSVAGAASADNKKSNGTGDEATNGKNKKPVQ